ncbi:MAG: T9SS type A sorting domain-containing protein [Bacteroidota bacterium]|nr:T9SS type A sorting domain-containing protein [Bacteroidota bacterium]
MVVEISGKACPAEGWKKIEKATYKVFDLQGREILAGQASSSPIKVNLSGQVAGTYFLRVSINGQAKSWKIVKE